MFSIRNLENTYKHTQSTVLFHAHLVFDQKKKNPQNNLVYNIYCQQLSFYQ